MNDPLREPGEIMDPLEQLCVMLAWSEDFSEEYKQERIRMAIEFVTGSYVRRK